MKKRILVTGASGFIGMHVVEKFLKEGYEVVGIDNFNPYYNVELKRARSNYLKIKYGIELLEIDLLNLNSTDRSEIRGAFDYVLHLAAQPGVRYSVTNPRSYVRNNLQVFLEVLEFCRNQKKCGLIYASSSSVYGDSAQVPFTELSATDHPVSLYAATKKSNELMAHSYTSLYGIPTIGLRFFTVYGPWGRPDMAVYSFTKKIHRGEPIEVYSDGQLQRDFTYVDDVCLGILGLIENAEFTHNNPYPATPRRIPFSIFNIGNNSPRTVLDLIKAIELSLGIKANIVFKDKHPGDVTKTCADAAALKAYANFSPDTTLEEGIGRFVEWYITEGTDF